MSAEVSDKRRAYYQDLSDLQAEYKKKRKEVQQQGENEVASTKNYYVNKRDEIIEDNQAAIVHIKKSAEKDIDLARTQAAQKIDSEKATNAKELEQLRRVELANKNAINRQISSEKEYGDERLSTVRKKSEQDIKQDSQSTQLALKKQQELRKEADARNNQDIQESAKKTHAAIQKFKQTQTEEEQKLSDQFQTKIEAEKKQKAATLLAERARGNKEVLAVRDKNNQELQQVRAEGTESVEDTRQRLKLSKEETAKKGEQSLKQIQTENKKQFETERMRGYNQLKKLQNQNAEDVKKIHEDSQVKIEDQKVKGDEKLKKQEATFTAEQLREQKSFEQRKEQQRHEHDYRLADENKNYDDHIKLIKQKHVKQYQNSEKANQDAIRAMDQVYNRELAKKKVEQMGSLQHYDEQSKDPFYKLENRGSQLVENGSSYTLYAYVPEHDKKHVQVRVQPDKVTVAGERKFQDKLEENGKTTATHSFQTFKEEFKFQTPVVHEAIKEERDGDYIKMEIPKRSWVEKIDKG